MATATPAQIKFLETLLNERQYTKFEDGSARIAGNYCAPGFDDLESISKLRASGLIDLLKSAPFKPVDTDRPHLVQVSSSAFVAGVEDAQRGDVIEVATVGDKTTQVKLIQESRFGWCFVPVELLTQWEDEVVEGAKGKYESAYEVPTIPKHIADIRHTLTTDASYKKPRLINPIAVEDVHSMSLIETQCYLHALMQVNSALG